MTKTQAPCPLCGEPGPQTTLTEPTLYECEFCGIFGADRHALVMLSDIDDKTNLSGVCREQFENGNRVTFTADNIAAWASLAPHKTDVETKIRKLLKYVAIKSQHPGQDIEFHVVVDRFACFARNPDEAFFILSSACDRGWIEKQPTRGPAHDVCVTPAGWAEYQNVEASKASQGFVAMWFDDELRSTYEYGLRAAIENSGYKSRRIDYEQFNSKIDDEILAEIRRSKFLVADVTGGRNGVFFEAGFALGLGLPVVWTCRKGKEAFMHFDTRQYNHIIWSSNEDLAERLELRIKATIGQGPLDVDKLLRERTQSL